MLRRTAPPVLLAALGLTAAFAASPSPAPAAPPLDAFLAAVAKDAVSEFAEKGLREDGLSISVAEAGGASGSFRGNVSYYPASVIKTFFLAYYEARKEDGTLRDTPELARAVKDMITISSNDATGFVVDSITDTTSGPELSGAEWDRWKERRNAVNRFFEKRGYRELNANQKTFCEDAYGREQAFRDGGKNRNRMTPNEIVRLFREISQGEIAGPKGTQEMLALLSRDVTGDKPLSEMEPEDARLAGHALPAGTRMWAKSGDAYDFHHLVARIVLPAGREFFIAVFTRGVKTVPEVIPRIYERVAARYAAEAPAPRP